MAAIIFDFDGTIADSFDYVAGFLADEAGAGPLTEAHKQELRGLSMTAMARHFGHNWWRLPWLLYKGRRRMRGVIHKLRPFDGITKVIEKLHAEGHELFIVSSNSAKNVKDFLRHHGLQTYFLEIYGSVGVFGKAPALRKLLREQNLEPKNAVYIGDELRDVQAAQSIKLPIVAVTWGFARPDNLKALKPTALANTPGDLIRVLDEI